MTAVVECCDNKPIGVWIAPNYDAALVQAVFLIRENYWSGGIPDDEAPSEEAYVEAAVSELRSGPWEEGDYTITIISATAV